MVAILFSGAFMALVISMFSITYHIDYVSSVFWGYPKGIAENCLGAELNGADFAFGFDTEKFITLSDQYFDNCLQDDYEGNYTVTYDFSQNSDYVGVESLPTECLISYKVEFLPLLCYEESITIYLRRTA